MKNLFSNWQAFCHVHFYEPGEQGTDEERERDARCDEQRGEELERQNARYCSPAGHTDVISATESQEYYNSAVLHLPSRLCVVWMAPILLGLSLGKSMPRLRLFFFYSMHHFCFLLIPSAEFHFFFFLLIFQRTSVPGTSERTKRKPLLSFVEIIHRHVHLLHKQELRSLKLDPGQIWIAAFVFSHIAKNVVQHWILEWPWEVFCSCYQRSTLL